MQEMKQMVKDHLKEMPDKEHDKAAEDKYAEVRQSREARNEQRFDWKERERHDRNRFKGSLLRK